MNEGGNSWFDQIFGGMTRFIVFMASCTFSACIIILVLNNATKDSVINLALGAALTALAAAITGFFGGKNPEQGKMGTQAQPVQVEAEIKPEVKKEEVLDPYDPSQD